MNTFISRIWMNNFEIIKKVSYIFVLIVFVFLYIGWINLCFNSPVMEDAPKWHRLQEVQMLYSGAFRLYSQYSYPWCLRDTTYFWGFVYDRNNQHFRLVGGGLEFGR